MLAFYYDDLSIAAALVITGAAAVAFAFLKGIRSYIAAAALSFLIGSSYGCAFTHFKYESITAFDGKESAVKGYIYDMQKDTYGSCYITVKGDINGVGGCKIRFKVSNDQFDELTYGDEAEVICTPSRYTGSYARYNKANGIFLNGGSAEMIHMTGKRSHRVFAYARVLRDKAYSYLCEKGGSGGKYLAALVTGVRDSTDTAEQKALYRVGIGHIFAFSGTHISIILSAAAAVIETLSERRRSAAVILILLAWLLALFSGLSVSAVRAAFMVSLLLLSNLAKRPSDPLTSLATAGFLITVISPYCVGSYSYILSFSGSLGCSAFAGALGERMNKDKQYPPMGFERSVISVICVSLLLMPIGALLFKEVSVISPIANLLIVPVCTVALMLGAAGLCICTVIPLFADYLVWLAGLIIRGVVTACGALSSLPFVYVSMHHELVRAAVVALSCLPVIAMLVIRRKRTLVLSYILSSAVMTGLSAVSIYLVRDIIFLTVYSTGKSDCLLISSSHGSIYAQSTGRVDTYTLDSYCLDCGIDHIDYAVINKTPHSTALTDKTRFYNDHLAVEDIGEINIDLNSITFLSSCGEGVVISEKKVYNRDSIYFTDLYPIEIEINEKTGAVTVRGHDNGFDIVW